MQTTLENQPRACYNAGEFAGHTPETMATCRICDQCGTVADYEPIPFAGVDMRRLIKFLCPACCEAMEESEREAARVRIREKRMAIWEETVDKKYRETDIHFPGFNRPLWDMLKTHPLGESVALIGPSGRSKTRVFALLARRAIAQDMTVGWCPANSFQWAAQREFDKEDGADAKRWMKRWQSCDVLFLDDLGKHRWTDVVEAAFFNLLESRSGKMLPTNWSMNPDPTEVVTEHALRMDTPGIMKRALDPTGSASARARFAPIVSRLTDETLLIPVP